MQRASLTTSDASVGQKDGGAPPIAVSRDWGPHPFGLQDKSASAASELLSIPPGYAAAVVLPCIHPICLATRLTSGFVRAPQARPCFLLFFKKRISAEL